MFTKQPSSSHQTDHDDQPLATIDRIHPAGLEPLPTYEPSPIINGSVIGSDLTILGENINIVSKESLQIEGEIHGDVSGKKVNIGINGMVVGTISAESVEIDGGVKGTVRALEIRLNAEAKVSGDLLHQSLVISQGAEFEGSVRRSRDVAELKPNLDVTSQVSIGRSPSSDKSSQSAPELAPDFYAETVDVKPPQKPALQVK